MRSFNGNLLTIHSRARQFIPAATKQSQSCASFLKGVTHGLISTWTVHYSPSPAPGPDAASRVGSNHRGVGLPFLAGPWNLLPCGVQGIWHAQIHSSAAHPSSGKGNETSDTTCDKCPKHLGCTKGGGRGFQGADQVSSFSMVIGCHWWMSNPDQSTWRTPCSVLQKPQTVSLIQLQAVWTTKRGLLMSLLAFLALCLTPESSDTAPRIAVAHIHHQDTSSWVMEDTPVWRGPLPWWHPTSSL